MGSQFQSFNPEICVFAKINMKFTYTPKSKTAPNVQGPTQKTTELVMGVVWGKHAYGKVNSENKVIASVKTFR